MKWRYLYRAFKARYRDQKLEIRIALERIRRGELAIDVGANKGAYLYWLRKAVGNEGRVLAFEPQAQLANYLQRICKKMRWQNVTVKELALSVSAGAKPLYVPGGGMSPGASLEPAVLRGERGCEVECKVATLDQEMKGLGRLAFLKVDVEGHELSVFRGGAETIQRDQPAILFECEARHLHSHSMNDVFAFLAGKGYNGAFFTNSRLRPLAEFDPATHQRRDSEQFWDSKLYCNNFLFVPEKEKLLAMNYVEQNPA